MPLVAYKNLPTFERLQNEGRTVIPVDRATHQDIREMHIGLLNMMPDAAITATERQFFRLVGESNQIAQIYIHPFTLPEIPRDEDTQKYIAQHYDTFEDLQKQGLDALIITGANPRYDSLEKEEFWEPLQKVIDWAWDNVTSTMCSCLATHAVMQARYNQKRSKLPEGKLWGVYRQRVRDREHPLVRNMNTVFDVPHSRWNDISIEQFEEAGMHVLIAGRLSGAHIAVSEDGFRLVCMQGHPEYDAISLLKEYQRELKLYKTGQRTDPPPIPYDYFTDEAIQKLILHNPEDMSKEETDKLNKELCGLIENTWTDSARSILASWIGLVYQTTNADRQKQFMEGVDPNDPLRWKSK